jgi:hypothetical protein
MKLYHGSTTAIDNPRIIQPNRALDFGGGFYCTSSLEQARRWAVRVSRIRGVTPVVSQYELDETAAQGLRMLRFMAADREWLDYVAQHRLEIYSGSEYDLIIGPVANDNTMPVIQEFMSSQRLATDYEIAVLRLRAQRLIDQYTFKTDAALRCLAFWGVA